MGLRKDGEGTRGKILESAIKVFAEKGFRNATHAEICKLSGANIAAINYHFRSKEALYKEALRTSFNRSIEVYPADGGVSQTASPEKRLRGRISSIIKRLSDPDNYFFKILHREFTNPPEILKEVIDESIGPMRAVIQQIVRELIGPSANDIDVELCKMSIMSQCFNPRLKENMPRLFSGEKYQEREAETEKVIEHITVFGLAGIKEIRKRIEKKD